MQLLQIPYSLLGAETRHNWKVGGRGAANQTAPTTRKLTRVAVETRNPAFVASLINRSFIPDKIKPDYLLFQSGRDRALFDIAGRVPPLNTRSSPLQAFDCKLQYKRLRVKSEIQYHPSLVEQIKLHILI